jgi:hypothetical protein
MSNAHATTKPNVAVCVSYSHNELMINDTTFGVSVLHRGRRLNILPLLHSW